MPTGLETELLQQALGGASAPRLVKQMTFLFELEKLKGIFRETLTPDASAEMGYRKENSGEHSWHIAVFGLMLHEYAEDKVDVLKTVKMLLLHELVEIYAGDTSAYSAQSGQVTHEKEVKAADKIAALLPGDQAVEYRALWDEFEAGQTPESKYARAIDRVHPIIANFLTRGRGWHERKITYDKVIATHEARITAGAPELWRAIKACLDYGKVNGFFYEPPTPTQTPAQGITP